MKKRITVYREKDRWAVTPANYGLWSWANSDLGAGGRVQDEIVCGFVVGRLKGDGIFHARDLEQKYEVMQARSLDHGETWEVVGMPCRIPGNETSFSADEHMVPELRVGRALQEGLEPVPVDCGGGIDFAHPDLAFLFARTGLGKGTKSWFYSSADRCRSWDGPFSFPDFGLPGVEARTDYLVTKSEECTFFLTASKESGGQGAGVFCARTTNGGRSFRFVGWVCQTEVGWKIMPSSVRLSESRILVSVRCNSGADDPKDARNWIETYASDDHGASWSYAGCPVADTGYGGNPPALTKLEDGRLCLTYGYRNPPFGIYAKLSEDNGETWSEPITLRENGGNHDIGYPRTVQLSDGSIFTVYWFNDHPEGERYIESVRWTP